MRPGGLPVRVEDVAQGDKLVGIGGSERTVVCLHSGTDDLYEIRPRRGEPWIVNGSHVLSLVRTPNKSDPKYLSQSGGVVVETTVRDWLGWTRWRKHIHKLYRSPVFGGTPVLPWRLPPYVLGVLLGDGCLTGSTTDLTFSKPDLELAEVVRDLVEPLGLAVNEVRQGLGRCASWRIAGRSGPGGNLVLAELRDMGLLPVRSEDRFVPDLYLGATWTERLELLAGIVDTDGFAVGGGYDLVFKSRRLAWAVAHLGRGLGLSTNLRSKESYCQTGAGGTYWRVSISGDCGIIPARIPRRKIGKRESPKDALRTGFEVAALGRGPYRGFTVDGDNLYLLSDHTVTHNCGKTLVFSRVVEACVQRGKRALILAHREELIEGAREKLIASTGVDLFQVGVEMASNKAADHHRVVVASVQTLKGDRLRRLPASEFGLVVVDEAHHSTAKSYKTIIDHFPDAKLLGVTATPDRMDGKGLGQVFASVAYVYEIADAIRDGYLVRVTGEEVLAGSAIDLSNVRTTAGDLNQGDLAEVLERDPAVALVAKATADKAGRRPTIVFAVSVAQARAIAAYINTYLGREAAVALDGTAPRDVRRAGKGRFERGEFQFLCNCALYTEGVDLPSAACISIARPTKSRALFCQMVGRGTRLLGATIEESVANGKDSVLVLDFNGVSGRHRLVTCADVLDGNTDEEVRRRVVKRAATGPVDIMQQLEIASAEIAEEARRRALADVQYRVKAMADPFTLLGVHPRAGRFGGRPATAEQLERLARHKIPGAAEQLRRIAEGRPAPVEPLDYGQASEILHSIGRRVREGKCSVRMAAILMKHGLNPDAPFATAKWALDQIAGNRWRPTAAVLAHPELRAK